MVEMGVSLTELAIKGTASAVNKKIRAVKVVKDAEKLRVTYDALINEVLQEREEAVRIAQAYKAELDRIEISDDIEHLHNTVYCFAHYRNNKSNPIIQCYWKARGGN